MKPGRSRGAIQASNGCSGRAGWRTLVDQSSREFQDNPRFGTWITGSPVPLTTLQGELETSPVDWFEVRIRIGLHSSRIQRSERRVDRTHPLRNGSTASLCKHPTRARMPNA
ncbi:unnamed protein product [Rangifer tarandus platyrhynchus]|uniref:Uncharacterized protein n=1 Tax=Rangifer tarandus platyrhynchus TaxID=3082113 RepID=A0AC59ZJC0_RANTA